ncbi:MAG: GxxExxY protein [Alphaproteobacteria bacterium]|nr:GxxExxY protein [Alphaproteobacteria bacterium]MCK5556551.1 GxxExxY protein [Alphaproteobacteria bacterium]MCK5658332.1 GxxExxY protein [Alphaproteobacteria bacterium]
MDTDRHGFQGTLLFKEETRQIIGCAMSVLNELGHGFLEKPYENALIVEFGIKKILCKQQPRYEIVYKNVNVGGYIPDLIAFDKVIVDLKAIERINDRERSQMLNYLKVTGLKIGLILNFSKPKLEWERIIL